MLTLDSADAAPPPADPTGSGEGEPHAHDPRAHAVVIGSGFGGLAAAIRLGAKGYRVTVLERLDGPGGRASVFKQDGFTFDAGPTIVTAPFLFEELWELCGRRFSDDVELRALEPFYKVRFDDGDEFALSSDPDAMRAEIARISPADAGNFERYMAQSEAIFRVGFLELGDQTFDDPRAMLKTIPDLVRLKAYRTVYGLVSHFFKHPKLRTALSLHPLLIGGNPFQVTSIYALIAHLERHWGVHYAMGGTHKLIEGMLDLLRGQGAAVRYEAEVAEITVEGGRATGVRLKNGERIAADLVVSNADSAWTYKHLLPAHARTRWSDAKLARAKYSMSLFVWYFGTDRRYDHQPHHMMVLGPRYKELLTDIFSRHKLADDFSLYLHRPSASDPSVAPDGCDAFYALSPVPHLDSGVDWETEAERYRRKIEKRLEETVLPDLGRHVVSSRMLTPKDFETRLLSHKGAAFGLAPIFTQSAWFRPHNKSEEVEGLYLVGAGTHPGAGIPGVLSSAKVLDRVIPDARRVPG